MEPIKTAPPYWNENMEMPPGDTQKIPYGVSYQEPPKQLKLYVPISTDSNDSVKRGYAVDMITELAGCEVCIEEMGDSHADRACNKMANAFLKTDCDAMLIIDCDIRFTKKNIMRMIGHLERGVKAVWGTYPKKNMDTEPCVCTFGDVPVPDEHGLAVVRRSGRGFLMVKREVFEALKVDNGGPCRRYHNHGEIQWQFFWSGLARYEEEADHGRDVDGYPMREWISEDWQFCETLRSYLGIPTLLDVDIVLGHVGSYTFHFGGSQICRMDSNITSWRNIDGWFDYEDLYRELVTHIPDGGTFMEVGCWLGKSIAAFHAFAKEAGKTVHLHVVDTFCGTPANPAHKAILDAHGGNVEKHFRENMKALRVSPSELKIHACSSVWASYVFPTENIDAIFIDADHSEAAVREDIASWLPVVKPGGILAGHDYDEEGVKAAVDAILKPKGEVKTVGRCWVFQKP
jgi:hypothetical protein